MGIPATPLALASRQGIWGEGRLCRLTVVLAMVSRGGRLHGHPWDRNLRATKRVGPIGGRRDAS
eukprot:4625517-Pyramimonas_sp.AAC.1